MEQFLTPRNALLLASLLFCVGVYGVLARRNLLVMLMSLEMMLVAANVALVAFSRWHGGELGLLERTADPEAFRHAHTGQFFTLMVMTVAAGEVGVGLAIVVTLYRSRHSLNLDAAKELRH
jgi:NADH-quinone oxidoreductase subunit K